MDTGKILRAIRESEAGSTGEIRVHLARRLWEPDPSRRAAAVFHRHGMTHTRDRNAVLLYVNLQRRRFAFVYDDGLRRAVDENYWRGLARNLESDLRSTHYENAIVLAVRTLGFTLKRHFPAEAAP